VETRTPGSASGLGKQTGSNPGTAPQADSTGKAIVLCADEKSSVQALDRTLTSLPMIQGRAQTMTHDYKRHGTTTLFAALDVLTGT
jgi:hypothetical protein